MPAHRDIPHDDTFSRLAIAWFRSTSQGVTVRRFNRDEAIYLDSEPAQSVLCLDSGFVKIVSDTPDGRECALEVRMKDELFGELCVCGHTARRESAFALSKTTVRIAPMARFMEFVEDQGLQKELLRHLANRVVLQQHNIAILLLESCERRLAHTLLRLGDQAGTDETLIPIRLSHGELGDMIGTTRSRVGQFLKNFRASGLIQDFDDGGVHIDRERLQAFCR